MVPTPLRSAAVEIDPAAEQFYRGVLQALRDDGVPFLIGGAYAFNCYTQIERRTKDLDLFIRRSDYERTVNALRAIGHDTELTFPHWLAKVHAGPVYIDVIFNSGNGISPVDDEWFRHAADAEVLGVPVRLSPVEEMIWSKAYIMERERYDGADVAHLLHARAEVLDWPRLLRRFGEHWRVLFSHLVLYGFIYPAERLRVPGAVMDDLIERLRRETHTPAPPEPLCGGTLLSREQYLPDLREEGLHDGRVVPHGSMTPADVQHWTDAIPERPNPGG